MLGLALFRFKALTLLMDKVYHQNPISSTIFYRYFNQDQAFIAKIIGYTGMKLRLFLCTL